MKKNKTLILWLIIFLLFWWHPGFYFALIIYFIIKSTKKNSQLSSNISSENTINVPNTQGIIIKCAKCGNEMTLNHKFCTNCGEAFAGNNVKIEYDETVPKPTTTNIEIPFVKPGDFDSMFGLTEESMVYEFLNRELEKAGVDKKSKLIPSGILKKRKILNIIFSFLFFCLFCLIFFHFPIATYVCGIIILLCLFKFTRSYNFMEYLKKQVKLRPNEKISNIVMGIKQTMVEDTSRKILIYGLLVSALLPMIIFIKPIILYEKTEGGYAVRYYIFGVTNFTSVTIPETHKNEKVISLRGNAFSNMPFLKEVTLPDTIVEIRGQAFKNDRALKNIKLPSNLNYLGGGAFYNCTSLEYIEIPDSVTYLGGEAFYNAKSLKNIKLSNNLLEIRGNTFENCLSLESVVIPDSVTRIGGHAFYGDIRLSGVSISKNSKLTEIGSSAFRRCNRLYEITLPEGVYVNERAFKESPTNVRTHGMVNKSDYEYNTFIYMNIGESKKINEYRSGAIIQDEYITLVNVIQNNGLYEFTFNVNGQQFTLTSEYMHHEVNSNLIIEIEEDYVFRDYSDRVSFYAYYN